MHNRLTPVVKNLIIANVAVFIVGSYLIPGFDNQMALFYFESPRFSPYQFVTYMFVHGGFTHILFNMMGLMFLAPMLESLWGPKKFLTFYLATGVGAALIYTGINFFQIGGMENAMEAFMASESPADFYAFISKYKLGNFAATNSFYEEFYDNPYNTRLISEAKGYVSAVYQSRVNVPMVGASGAVYGVLMAIAMLFPNMQMMLLFPPIPIKAKYMALGLAGISLYSGISNNPDDNVAHFAHLGGMIVAYILIVIWRKNPTNYY